MLRALSRFLHARPIANFAWLWSHHLGGNLLLLELGHNLRWLRFFLFYFFVASCALSAMCQSAHGKLGLIRVGRHHHHGHTLSRELICSWWFCDFPRSCWHWRWLLLPCEILLLLQHVCYSDSRWWCRAPISLLHAWTHFALLFYRFWHGDGFRDVVTPDNLVVVYCIIFNLVQGSYHFQIFHQRSVFWNNFRDRRVVLLVRHYDVRD